MLTYPGGHIRHAHINGYAFFLDSLSDLGETRTPTGRPKVASLVFFCSALLLVACTLPAFFVAYATLFARDSASRWIAIAGACAALIAGLSFAGVAGSPANLNQSLHNVFEFAAFWSFLAAVLCGFLAAVCSRSVPRSIGFVFGAFAILLAAYLGFSALGHILVNPSLRTRILFGATPQKVVMYASILTIMIQAATLARLPPGSTSKSPRCAAN